MQATQIAARGLLPNFCSAGFGQAGPMAQSRRFYGWPSPRGTFISESCNNRSAWRKVPLHRERLGDVKVRLDAIDWMILKELQGEGRITNVELASRVGISAPPCLRRVRALEEAGVIRGYRALLEEKSLGFDLTAFAFIGLNSQAESELVAFEEKIRQWPIVRECFMASGEIDFILKCVAPDLRAFQTFIIDQLTKAPTVGSVRTALVIRRVKDEPLVPVE
jgi:DNA-binding Lrp family transcriptional regulator